MIMMIDDIFLISMLYLRMWID